MPTALTGIPEKPPSLPASSSPAAKIPAPVTAPRRRRKIGGWARAGGPVLVLSLWLLVTSLGWVSPTILPHPVDVLGAAGNLLATGQLQEHLLVSLQRAMTGLVLGVTVGLALAVFAGLFTFGEILVDANIQVLRSLPTLALVPLAIVWFGIGESAKIILVTLAVMTPIYLNVHAGIRGTDVRYLDLAKTLGLSRTQIIRRVILPGSLPGFFTGLRFSVTIAWLALVASEQINASSGIGYLMTHARSISATDVIMVGLIVYGVLGLASDTLVRIIERKVLVWRSTVDR